MPSDSRVTQALVLGALKAKWVLLETQRRLFSSQHESCLEICHLVIFQKEFTLRVDMPSTLLLWPPSWDYLRLSGKEKTDITLVVILHLLLYFFLI